jgi:predicted PurR-regulated permease PerM
VATPVPPRLPPGERLRRVGVGAWSVIGLLILLAISVWLLFKIKVIFPPLVLALLIIYLLNPLVNRLEERRVPRALGAILTYVVVIGSIVLIVLALAPVVSSQIQSFSDDWPEFREKTVRSIQTTSDSIEDRFGTRINTSQIECLLGADDIATAEAPTHAECNEETKKFRELVGDQADRITELGGTLLEVLIIFILAPLLALYLIIDLPKLQKDWLSLVPEQNREEFAEVGSKMGRAVGGFFRGQLVVAFVVFILSSVAFRIVGLPFWLVIGAIAGLTNLIPLVGPFIGGGLGVIIGTMSGGASLGLKAAAAALVVQQIDNHIISPNVMKRTVQLHPVTVMLGLLAGGTLAGFWGVLLAVPAIAVTKIVVGHVWTTRVLGLEPTPFNSDEAVPDDPQAAEVLEETKEKEEQLDE